MNGSPENSENFAALFEKSETPQPTLRQGEKVTGKIIAITADSAFVDLGLKQDGVLDKEDLPQDANVGDEVTAYVIGFSSQGARLSRSMAGAGMAALEDALASQIPVKGRVKEACKGGYRVEVLGKLAFCPGSQMERVQGNDSDELIGREMMFLVTRVEERGRNIVVSRRALLDKERDESLGEFLESHKVGDTIEGKITRLAPFGAFMEVAPGLEGMIHISQLAWSRVDRPDEAVSVGDEARAKIVELARDEKGNARIALSIKQAEGDPWLEVDGKFKAGDIVTGKVRRLAPFGAFIEIAPGIEGLVHLSEMAWGRRVNKAGDVVEIGETVPVKVKEINSQARRISLSMKDAEADPWLDAPELFAPGTVVEGIVESQTPHGIFVTLKEGVTGLLPSSATRNSGADFKNVAPGDKLELIVQNLDSAARRISLMPKDKEEAAKAETDESWRQHVEKQPVESMGIMAQALQKAIQKRKNKA